MAGPTCPSHKPIHPAPAAEFASRMDIAVARRSTTDPYPASRNLWTLARVFSYGNMRVVFVTAVFQGVACHSYVATIPHSQAQARLRWPRTWRKQGEGSSPVASCSSVVKHRAPGHCPRVRAAQGCARRRPCESQVLRAPSAAARSAARLSLRPRRQACQVGAPP